MRINWKTEWPNWVIIAGMWIFAAITWSSAPDRFPVHWNIQGQVNRYGGKLEGVLLLPLMSLGIYLLLVYLPRIDPGRANYERFSGPYGLIRASVLVLMAAIYGITQLWVRGYQVDMSLVVPFLVGGLLIVIGNVMGKIRPNWFVGIRTPWTLSSKMSWTRTHRLGGWMFILFGLGLMVAGALRSSEFMVALGIAGGAALVWLFVYSYLVWREDPDRVSPSGTLPG